MATRDQTYHRFGPILLESLSLVLLDEINTLRDNQGLPALTEEDLLASVANHLSSLPPYDWQTKPQDLSP